MKVPPANELKTISVIVLVPCRMRPRMIPIGVAAAKTTSKKMPFLCSSFSTNCFVIELPRDIAAASLWATRASMIFTVALISLVKPNAIPSKIACIERANTSTRLDSPKPEQIPFVSFSI